MAKPVAQIFLSYAHLDNTKPQGFEIGWVDRLHDALEVELPTHGVQVRWWRDRRDLDPESYFDETILDAVSRSDAFVAILSPVYPQRPFCLKELTHFLDLSRARGADEPPLRVLKVVKRPIADPAISGILPEEISGSGEFRFYALDRQTERVLLFIRSNGEIARPEFWDAIEELAAAIARTVQQIKPRPEIARSNHAIYLAEPTDDQSESYRTIRSELMASGFQVLPRHKIPDDYREALAFIDDQLSRCILSVHLLGERSGYIPSARAGEPTKPITRLQLDQAAARCEADPSFQRFIWARKSLSPTQDDQQTLVDAFKKGIGLLHADEFITEPLELFKNAVLDHLRRRLLLTPSSRPKGPHPVLLVTHPSDRTMAADLTAALHAADYEVLSMTFDAVEAEDENRIARLAAQVDAAIVLFAPADETWAKLVLATLHNVSTARGNQGPALRAVLFRSGSNAAAAHFRSHYCDAVLTSRSEAWDDVPVELRAHLDRAAAP